MHLPSLRSVLFSAAVICATSQGDAALVVSNFSSGENISSAIFSGTWIGAYQDNVTFGTIGSPATGDGYVYVNLQAPLDIGTVKSFSLTARVDAGNVQNSFLLSFHDGKGLYGFAVVSASSFTSGFSTQSFVYTSLSGFDPTDVRAFSISGGGAAGSGQAFRMSFDQLTVAGPAIPEPASAAYLSAFAALCFAGTRRTRRLVG